MKGIIIIFIFLLISCNYNRNVKSESTILDNNIDKIENPIPIDCSTLPRSFQTYDEAIRIIKETHFLFTEHINTTSSSWIRSASYYSCDNLIGYLILYTDRNDYIYKDLPKNVWEQFKTASSFGSFYHQNIKNKYQFYLTVKN